MFQQIMSTLMVKSVGKHPKVYFIGSYNQRPLQLRYVFIWDVEIVLQYIRGHWYDNSSLTDADLTTHKKNHNSLNHDHGFEGVHNTAP